MASPLTAAVVSALLLAAALGAAFPRGHVHRTLYDQRLSHLAFHSGDLKPALARLVSDPATSAASVAVVGVEWGAEVVALAEIGFHVYAFEPVAKFVAHLEEVLKEKPHLNVTVLPIAAVAERNVGNVTLEYPNAGVSESVASGIVDDFVKGELAVLSIDVQGNELEVLQGAKHLLSGVKPAVRSMVRFSANNSLLFHCIC